LTYNNIVFETKEPGILLLTINRPKLLNALNRETLEEIKAVVKQIREHPEARILMITGAGDRSFVAGADIKEMQNYTAVEAQEFSRQGMGLFRALEKLPIPVVAVVNGFCLGGGCELAMSCDWILASDTAVFGQPEVNLGVTPGFGGSQRLSRLVGRAAALELLITGRMVKVSEARSIGLVNHVYPAASLMDKALEMARTIAAKGPIGVRLIKESVQRGQDMDLSNACVLERQMFGVCFSTADQKEGMTAFLEKRTAEFKNC